MTQLDALTLDPLSFGRQLIARHDLDPVYEMLYAARLERPLLQRWLLAYWWFYHAGVASRIARSDDFYGAALDAFDRAAPRGTERRHFRGARARESIVWFSTRFQEPGDAILAVAAPTFAGVRVRVLEWPQFGPWMAFKVADMLERCAGYPIDFSDCELQMYQEPTAGALLLYRQRAWSPADAPAAEQVPRVTRWLEGQLADCWAPPDYGRRVGIQEVETVLCKYKAHVNGHYPVGKDLRELRHALDNWGSLAADLARALQRLPPARLEVQCTT